MFAQFILACLRSFKKLKYVIHTHENIQHIIVRNCAILLLKWPRFIEQRHLYPFTKHVIQELNWLSNSFFSEIWKIVQLSVKSLTLTIHLIYLTYLILSLIKRKNFKLKKFITTFNKIFV